MIPDGQTHEWMQSHSMGPVVTNFKDLRSESSLTADLSCEFVGQVISKETETFGKITQGTLTSCSLLHKETRLTLKQYPLGAMVYSYTYAEFQLSNHIFIIVKYTVPMEHVYQI